MLHLQVQILTAWTLMRVRVTTAASRARDDRGELTAGVIFLVALAVAAVAVAAIVISRLNSQASKIPE
jgi:uncharacterized membrane protein